MIKFCKDHPELTPLVMFSGNQKHVACVRCPQCDRFLGWMAQAALANYIEDLETEIIRLRAIAKQQPELPEFFSDNLDEIWALLLAQMPPAARDLFKAFGELNSLADGRLAIVMKARTAPTIATMELPEFGKLLSRSLGRGTNSNA